MDPVRTVEYSYDAVGNRLKMVADGRETEYVYDQADRMIRAGEEEFLYDDNGNLIEKIGPDMSVLYEYTGDNKLQGVYYPDGSKVEFLYDAFRSKVSRTQFYYDQEKINQSSKNGNSNGKSNGNGKGKKGANQGNDNALTRGEGEKKGLLKRTSGSHDEWLSTETTLYVYDGLNVMKEYGENGQPLAQYYEANGEVVARQMFGLHGRKSDEYEGNIQTRGGLMYYMKDALGNVMDITDRIGDTIMKYRYDAFGNLFTQMASPYNSVGFTGKTYDAKASLMDYSARWYSPKHGRFTTEDTYPGSPDYPASLHRYAYVGNNPVNYTDPTGNYYWCESVSPTGRVYSHAPPCDDPNNKVWYDDPDDGEADSGGSDDGSSGGGDSGYTPPPPPPPPTPEEIKAGKRAELYNLTGSGSSHQSVLDRSGTSQKKNTYGYDESSPKPPPIQVTTSGSKQWGNHFTESSNTSRYAGLTNDFLSPNVSSPNTTIAPKSASPMLASAGKFVYDTIIGDNINTIKDPNASMFSKTVAVLDVGSNFIPGAGQLKMGGTFVVKAGAKLLKEPAKKVVKAASGAVKQGVSKAAGWIKGLGSKSSSTSKGKDKSGGNSPDFVVTPNGGAIPIPKGAKGPTPVVNPQGKVTGQAYTGGKGGANSQVDTVRIMEKTPPRGKSPGYPNGYVKYENKSQQGVDFQTGKTISNSKSHIRLK